MRTNGSGRRCRESAAGLVHLTDSTRAVFVRHALHARALGRVAVKTVRAVLIGRAHRTAIERRPADRGAHRAVRALQTTDAAIGHELAESRTAVRADVAVDANL